MLTTAGLGFLHFLNFLRTEFSLRIHRAVTDPGDLHAILLISIEFSADFPRGYGTNSGDAINSQRLILISSDSAVREFEVGREFVLKSRINVSEGVSGLAIPIPSGELGIRGPPHL